MNNIADNQPNQEQSIQSDPNISNQDTNKRKTPPKLSKLDKNILTATKALTNPTKANIARHVVELGGAKHIQTVYKRLKQKDYLRGELQAVEQYEYESLHREDLPLARKRARKAIKNKDLNDKEVFPYVKLIYDKAYGEVHKTVGQSGISIDTIESIQIMVNADVSRNLGHDD